MKKYVVFGKVTAYIEVDLEAENKKEAIDKAYNECSKLMNFVGINGYDELVGICNSDDATVSIYCDDEIEYTEAEEIK